MSSERPTRTALAQTAAARIDTLSDALSEQWHQSEPVRHFVVDDFLPDSIAHAIHAAVPEVGSLMRQQFMRVVGTNFAEISVDLASANQRDRTGHEIKNEIRDLLQDVTGATAINFEETRRGPPVGQAVMLRVKGDSFETLRVIADEIMDYLHNMEGVKDIVDNFPPGKDEVRPRLDLEKVAGLRLGNTW